jgi:hypothetical protein
MATKKSAKAAPVQAIESAAPVVAPVAEEVVTAYKGFDKNLQCRGMQYAIGETAVHKGKVEACEGGLHACTLPIDVFNYYKPNESRFCVVKVSGKLSRKDGDSKIASAMMTVEAEIGIPGIVAATVKALLALVQKPTTGYSAHSATTGNYAHSATTGDSAHSATTGDSAHSATTGYSAHSATTGNYAHSATTGYSAHSATTGYSAHSATTGNYAHSATTGYSAHSATTGYSAHSATTGYSAHSATTGNYATRRPPATPPTRRPPATPPTRRPPATPPTRRPPATPPTRRPPATTPTRRPPATPPSPPRWASLSAPRPPQLAPIVLAHFNSDLSIKHIRASKVGENGIKADTWYVLDTSGEFEEVAQ